VKAFILIAAYLATYLAAFLPASLAAIEPAAARDFVARPAQWSRPALPTVRRAVPPPAIAIPQQFSPPQEAYASFPEAPATTAPGAALASSEPSPCRLRLGKLAAFKPLPVLVGPGECGAADAVLLESVTLPDGTRVTFAPPATLRCTMAEQMALWLREDLLPASASLGTQMRVLEDYDSYECRGQNRVRGATLSEHGRANALDLRGFKLANGKMVELTDVNVAKEWRESLRASACARFHTVLGPGSDGNHETHIHVDLAERRSGYKICQWDVREPVKVAEKAKLETEEKAKPTAEEKARPVAEEKAKPAVAGKATPATVTKAPPEPEKKAKPVVEAKATPAAATKATPELEKKTKPVAEEKATPEPEKKAAALGPPLPVPPRPNAGTADKSPPPPTAEAAAEQSRAPAGTAHEPRHAKKRRWRYYRWWWW
jgi:hypothetical protein